MIIIRLPPGKNQQAAWHLEESFRLVCFYGTIFRPVSKEVLFCNLDKQNERPTAYS